MVKFLVTSVVVLICLFLMALLLCLMVWVITRLLRFLFPQRFRSQAPAKKEKEEALPGRDRGGRGVTHFCRQAPGCCSNFV